MELIAAAYVNHIGQRQPRNPEIAERLVAAYEKHLLPVDDYEKGKFRAPEVLVEGEISPDDIAVALDGAVWFGTDGYGASRFDGKTWTTYTTANGLISNTIRAIAVTKDGALWFATNSGVSRYRP